MDWSILKNLLGNPEADIEAAKTAESFIPEVEEGVKGYTSKAGSLSKAKTLEEPGSWPKGNWSKLGAVAGTGAILNGTQADASSNPTSDLSVPNNFQKLKEYLPGQDISNQYSSIPQDIEEQGKTQRGLDKITPSFYNKGHVPEDIADVNEDYRNIDRTDSGKTEPSIGLDDMLLSIKPDSISNKVLSNLQKYLKVK